MFVQPRKYLNHIKYRRHAYGTERRRNMTKIILEHGTPIPLPLHLEDVDMCMYEWVRDTFNLTFDGKRIPTYKLFSTQRISEYTQSWEELDENGNVVMNFKTITRDNNPQIGESQGGYFNIPGHRDFTMFYVPVLDENGTESYDKYTVKQPFAVNLTYSVSIIANKLELLNRMNESMLYEFNAKQCYICPNGHYVPLTIEDISDDSEYSIDDRKYYSQTFKIKCKAYVIREEDYKVERIPSRVVIRFDEGRKKTLKRGEFQLEEVTYPSGFTMPLDYIYSEDERCEVPTIDTAQDPNKDIPVVEDGEQVDDCGFEEDPRYFYKRIHLIVNIDDCSREVEFIMDTHMTVKEILTENVFDMSMKVNDKTQDMLTEIELKDGDKVYLKIERDNPTKWSKVYLEGVDKRKIFDAYHDDTESSLDEYKEPLEETIEIGEPEPEEGVV